MCVRIHYTIDLNVLKRKYNCSKVVNNEKLKKGMINKKNYIPTIFENNENSLEKIYDSQKKNRIIHICIWGINPFNYGKFEKDIALINARLETLHLKKSFKILINKNRCAIIINGYFEWKNDENSSKKIPYYIFNGKSNQKDNEQNSLKKIDNEEIDSKNNEEINQPQNVKNEVEDDEIYSNEEKSQPIEQNSHKRKKITKEVSTKKIKIESSNEECEENESYIILAGLYTVPDDDKKEYRNTVITTSSENTNLKDIHERCPLLLSENSLSLWLNVDNSYSDIIDKIKEEHINACNNLKYMKVQDWNVYSNYSKQEKKESILKYMK
ncbi:conserved protein, unknown function [Plasmodium gallinaceum]|uniref:SRAP domain-containing protein n=1 Tax=Plasmodium gallinaceum TaxID=5849 RepID=A0A1J1GU49_PLAGA|nr:conserved protein, unknown function [Plasmodium gallinaceum]CRG95983.1 conserved protein, unknown function [Plasmodium gallinaceum]